VGDILFEQLKRIIVYKNEIEDEKERIQKKIDYTTVSPKERNNLEHEISRLNGVLDGIQDIYMHLDNAFRHKLTNSQIETLEGL